jgi:Xaa-Pro aminopeptidase
MHAHGVDHPRSTRRSPPEQRLEAARRPDDTIVETRMVVTVDWGARLDGYCSTARERSGRPDPGEAREIYDVCLKAQLAAVAGIRPGMTGVEADGIARGIISDAGYGEEFGHGLGHGVGVAIHEAPRLSVESSDTLEVGNVITIEPGIYLPGLGGVRIEDLAVVREDGLELLTSFPKDLITVG